MIADRWPLSPRPLPRLSDTSDRPRGYLSGLHLTAVGRIERAEREPDVRTVYKLARALEVEPGELFEVSETAPQFEDCAEPATELYWLGIRS